MSSKTRKMDAVTSVMKVYERAKGGQAIFRCIQPHGYWQVSWDKGELPSSLKGKYLSLESAKRAAKIYLRGKGDDLGAEITIG